MQQLPRGDQYSYLWQSVRNERARREFEDIQLARYARPSVTGFEKQPQGKPAIHMLWDDTAIKANKMFGNGLWSITHSTAIHWFEYKLPEDKRGDQEGDTWAAEIVTKDLRREFTDGGLYLALLLRLYDVGVFGYGAVYSYEDPDRPGHLAYEWVPAAECFYLLDGKGRCQTFVRPLWLTAAEALDQYKFDQSAVDQPVLTAYANRNHTQRFLFLHIVEPRKGAPPNPKDNTEYPYRGLYFYPQTKGILKEHGFMSMPYHVLTWGGSRGDPYPVSIGYETLPEIRNINSTRKRFDRLLENETDSPILGPDAGEQPGGEQFRPNPGDFIPSGMNGDGKRLYDLLYSSPTGGRNTINEVQQSRALIQDAWFNSLFLMTVQGRQMTAEEVRSRDAKIIQAMGPFVIFMAGDMEGICERTFEYRLMRGVYDPLPQILDPEDELDLMFDGLLAKALEAQQGNQIIQLMAEAQIIAQYDPEAVLAGTDFNAAYRALASSRSIPHGIVHSEEKYQQNRKDRADQQQQQQMMAAAPGLAKAAKDGADAIEGMASAQKQIGGPA